MNLPMPADPYQRFIVRTMDPLIRERMRLAGLAETHYGADSRVALQCCVLVMDTCDFGVEWFSLAQEREVQS